MNRYNIFILKSKWKRLLGKPGRRRQVECGLNLLVTTSRYEQLAGYREDSNITSGYIKGMESLVQLSDYHLLKQHSPPCR
jgi:hypothetical protein